jgi:hypothetical protein
VSSRIQTRQPHFIGTGFRSVAVDRRESFVRSSQARCNQHQGVERGWMNQRVLSHPHPERTGCFGVDGSGQEKSRKKRKLESLVIHSGEWRGF